ncbi:MAG: UDP-N-acetylmuramate dehydrogenase [Candidatus Hydrogenedentes bacterium]|nr:UDP-N-acetylmuramate dehydrogenase [Candidatus Hydrogenedentota bacterium]
MKSLPFEFAVPQYPLAPATLYNVGGPAQLALLPRSMQEAQDAYLWMCEQPGRKLVLGGGSNVLIADEGFPGIVLFTTGLNNLDTLSDGRYAVESGVELARLVSEVMLPNNFEGTAGLTGIPGSVGGAIYMNAGTASGTTLEWVEGVDVMTPDGLVSVNMDPALYGYRGQTFCPPGGLILRGQFRFVRSEKDQKPLYDHYMQRRKDTQPQGHCCGSVFKNPEGNHAGRLIEACGLKGTRRGGAEISPKHANFIMNVSGATCSDVVWLIDLAKRSVKEKFGVDLEEEVKIIR